VPSVFFLIAKKERRRRNEKKVKVIASGIFAPNEQELGEGTVQVCRDKIQRKKSFHTLG
jgi:hypothetical protein